jgi:hypothetical protein
LPHFWHIQNFIVNLDTMPLNIRDEMINMFSFSDLQSSYVILEEKCGSAVVRMFSAPNLSFFNICTYKNYNLYNNNWNHTTQIWNTLNILWKQYLRNYAPAIYQQEVREPLLTRNTLLWCEYISFMLLRSMGKCNDKQEVDIWFVQKWTPPYGMPIERVC